MKKEEMDILKKILILGGGYGGLVSALTARKYLDAQQAEITLINRWPTHQIITELHRLAAGNLSEQSVGLPLDKLLKGKDIHLQIGTIEQIKPDEKQVLLKSGKIYAYDLLVVALGSETAFFGIPGLEQNSFTLKSIDDANRIRAHIQSKIASYSMSKDKSDATIVVGGGGLTGVELVGELADMMPDWCLHNGVDVNDISIYCVEASPNILNGFDPELIERAKSSLQKRGIQFITGVPITEINENIVHLKDGRSIQTNTLVWTGGVQGNPIVANSGVEVNRGRATVNEFLVSTSHSDIFLAGDSAIYMDENGRPYPPSAQLAWQMGETVGYNIYAAYKELPMKAFQPVLSGKLASLGRKDAIATIGERETHVKGLPASLLKEASKARYLAHIKGLFAYAY